MIERFEMHVDIFYREIIIFPRNALRKEARNLRRGVFRVRKRKIFNRAIFQRSEHRRPAHGKPIDIMPFAVERTRKRSAFHLITVSAVIRNVRAERDIPAVGFIAVDRVFRDVRHCVKLFFRSDFKSNKQRSARNFQIFAVRRKRCRIALHSVSGKQGRMAYRDYAVGIRNAVRIRVRAHGKRSQRAAEICFHVFYVDCKALLECGNNCVFTCARNRFNHLVFGNFFAAHGLIESRGVR